MDAPANANCWNLNSPAGSNCDNWSKVSNNLMDYNADQSSLSPCQIGIMQNNLNTCLQGRYVYKCSDCLPTSASFELPASTCGNLTNIWLDGRGCYNEHWFKLGIDRISGSTVWEEYPVSYHYETMQWRPIGRERLDALYNFQPNSVYQVKLTTYNNCGSVAMRMRTLSTQCYEIAAPPAPPTTAARPAAPTSTSATPNHEK